MEPAHGFLLIDKPAGITSHDVVDVLRRVTGIKKIGHAGTLDPFATGLLICAIGRPATKRIAHFSKLDKTYEATFVLGATSETLDPESDITMTAPLPSCSREEIETAMQTFTGDILQVPPMYSAIKVRGKKLYELARKGETIEREPRPIHIFSFELLSDPVPTERGTLFSIRTHVSSGTYIRALARDLASALQTVGYLQSLRRTSIGPYSVENAAELGQITPETWSSFLIDDHT